MAEHYGQHMDIGGEIGREAGREAGRETGWDASGQAERGPAGGTSTYTTSEAGAKGRETLEEAKQAGAEVVGRAKAEGKSILTRQKDAAAGEVDSVAHAFRDTAQALAREHHEQTGRYVGYAAEQLEALGQRLRERDIDGLIGDAQEMARRSPGVFFGGAVLAGFLLARFLKASGERRSAGDDGGAWRERERYPADYGERPDYAQR